MEILPLPDSHNSWYRVLAEKPLGRTLDVACGDGDFAEDLLVELGTMTGLVGIDVDDSDISRAKTHFLKHAPDTLDFRFYTADIWQLLDRNDPILSPPWHSILIGIALHHIPRAGELLVRLFTLLEPGGRLLVSEMVNDGLSAPEQVARDFHHLKARVDSLLGIHHLPTFSRGEILSMARVVEKRFPQSDIREFLVPQGGITQWDKEKIEAHIEFMGDYLLNCKDRAEYSGLKRELSRLIPKIRCCGYRQPPRLNLIISKSTNGRVMLHG